MAFCEASMESIWMVDSLKHLGVSLRGPMVVNVDNQGSIALAKNPVFHDRSKGYRHTVSFHARSRQGADDPPRVYTNHGHISGPPHEVPAPHSARATFRRRRFILVFSPYARLAARGVCWRYVSPRAPSIRITYSVFCFADSRSPHTGSALGLLI